MNLKVFSFAAGYGAIAPIWLLAILSLSCSGHIKPGNKVVSLETNATFQENKKAVLEVWTESKFVVYPPGKILNLKFYDSDRAEFDYYPQDQRKPFFVERRRFLLDDTETEAIVRNLSKDSVVGWKQVYEPTVPILDAAIETTIIIKRNDIEKRIVLKENHSNLILEKKSGIYPETLLSLLRLIQNIDRQVLAEERPSQIIESRE